MLSRIGRFAALTDIQVHFTLFIERTQDVNQSIVKRLRSALRMREKSAAANPVR